MSESAEIEEAAAEPSALPLDHWHRARGARMVGFAGYAMPVQYAGEGGGIIAEHLWTRESAGLFDVSHMGQLEISGVGAAAAIEALAPVDLATLAPGRQRYSLLLDDTGGILDDLMIANRGDRWHLVVNGATKWDDIAHLREHLPDEVTLNHLDDHGLLALQGPRAVDALARLVPGVAGLRFMDAGMFDWLGMALGVSRSGYTGEDGFEISVRDGDIVALAGALASQPEVRPAGLGARDSLRLEAGLPLYGHDLSPDTGAVEAGLAFAINRRRRAEGGFAGATRTLRELAQGAPRRRVGMVIDGRMAAREGAEVLSQDEVIGVVTSGGFSPSLGHPVAMALIGAAHAATGAALEIEVRGKRLAATVVALPFVPHRYHR